MSESLPESNSNRSSIPHADLIRAVLDGKTVQWSPHIDREWKDYVRPQDALEDLVKDPGGNRYRLKPEPQVRWLPIFLLTESVIVDAGYFRREEATLKASNGKQGKVLRLELDPDTLDVISAKTEAP